MGKFDLWDGETAGDRPDIFDGRLIRWFEERLREMLEDRCTDEVISLLVAERESLLYWDPSWGHRGEGHSKGEWQLDPAAVLRAVHRISGKIPYLKAAWPSTNSAHFISWFQTSVCTYAQAPLAHATAVGLDSAQLVSDLVLQCRKFLMFYPKLEYAENRVAGSWRLDLEKITSHINAQIVAHERQTLFRGLPEAYHTSANRGAVVDNEPSRTLAEPSARHLLSSKAGPQTLNQFVESRKQINRKWPRVCRQCGAEHNYQGRRGQPSRCERCASGEKPEAV